MKKILRGWMLAAVMLLGAFVPLTFASPASASSGDPCVYRDFYSYTAYDYAANDLYDAYDNYTICPGWARYNYTWRWYY